MVSKMATFLFGIALCLFTFVFAVDLACMLRIVPVSAVAWAGPAASCGLLFLFLGGVVAWRAHLRRIPY